jgi:hypothetical protein
VTPTSRPDADDSPWRRPATDPGAESRPRIDSGGSSNGLAYEGPPPTNPPPAGWRPPVVAQPPSPRPLPEQDHGRLDVAEQGARTLTYGVGMVVGAILLVLILLLCARVLF